MRNLNLIAILLITLSSQPVFSQEDQGLPEGTMAVRGKGSISREMFDAKISRIPKEDRAGVLRSSERLKKIMADLLLTSQLNADAAAAGFDQGDIQYRMKLAADTELSNAWLNHYVDSQPEADYKSMAYEYYLLHKDEMLTTPSRDVTHLLVSTENQSVEEAEAIINSILEQIAADPSSFDGLVVERSEDPSVGINKGHFTDVKNGDMVLPFEEAMLGLKAPGDFSEPVYTRFGIHIIRLDKINPARMMEFEEVEPKLVRIQRKAHKERLRYAYLSELGSQQWEVSDDEIKAMVNRYFSADELKESTILPDSE